MGGPRARSDSRSDRHRRDVAGAARRPRALGSGRALAPAPDLEGRVGALWRDRVTRNRVDGERVREPAALARSDGSRVGARRATVTLGGAADRGVDVVPRCDMVGRGTRPLSCAPPARRTARARTLRRSDARSTCFVNRLAVVRARPALPRVARTRADAPVRMLAERRPATRVADVPVRIPATEAPLIVATPALRDERGIAARVALIAPAIVRAKATVAPCIEPGRR